MPANAALNDTVHPFASVAYSYDDNLLRLPEGAAEGGGGRSDTSRQALAGFRFERPFGRQVLSGEVKVSRVTFDHFDQLNYNGKDFSGVWRWQLGNHLEGRLGGSYAQTLTPFADFHSDERNIRSQRREYVDGNWRFHPSWRLRSSFAREKFSYDLQAQRFNDRTEDTMEAGGDYLASSGSRLGLVARRIKGSYPNHRSLGNVVVDDGYEQDELKLDGYWNLGGVTQLQFLAGWAKRKHAFFTERNSNGLNGRLSVQWKPSAKLKFSLGGWREFAAVESSIVNSSLNKGGSLSATYDITAKLQGTASFRREQRRFNEASGVTLPGDKTDSTRSASLGLTYAPQNFVQFGVSAFHDQRSGNPFLGAGAYRANGMSLSVATQF